MCFYWYWDIFNDLFFMIISASCPMVIPSVLVCGGFSAFGGCGTTSSVFRRVRSGESSSSGGEAEKRVDPEPSFQKNLGPFEGLWGFARIGEQEGVMALEKVYRSYPDTFNRLL